MKLWRWLLLPALAALALLLYGGGFTSVAAPPDDPPDFAPGELLVKARPWVSEATATAAAAAEGAGAAERLRGLDVYRVSLPPGVGVAEAVDFYVRLPWVEFAEPNYYVRADVVPNDSLYAANQSWYYDLIQAPAAWDITTGSSSIVVAVVDTGIDLDHPDLDGKLETGAAFVSAPTDSGDAPGFSNCQDPQPQNDPNDDEGHGTFVAGIIGAETNNGAGVAGTAWGVRLMPVKVLDCNGVGLTSDVALGIAHAAANGADVINLSLGGPRSSPSPCGSTLGNAITNAIGAGAILVAASGNENVNEVSCPAAHPRVIAVGASGGQSSPDGRADCPSDCFSNWGPEIDVVAPGVSISSTWWTLGGGSTYASGSGTSFSTPLVSGLAALILSQSPSFDYAKVRSVLCASAVDLADGSTPGWDGCGRIRMHTALVTTPPAAPGDYNDDGKTDPASWRPASNSWYINDVPTIEWGASLPGDIPVPGDYNGDGKTDAAIWRPSTNSWYINDLPTIQWGASLPGDIPVPGDYNGDGETDAAIWRPFINAWYINGVPTIQWGASIPGDVPVPGDYNDDGKTEAAIWRPSSNSWYIFGVPAIQWGASLPGDVPVPGDYNGDGKTDAAIWRPSTNSWYINGLPTIQWGASLPGDIPVPGNYNGDGKTDAAIWRPSSNSWYINGLPTIQWGASIPGDVPVPGD